MKMNVELERKKRKTTKKISKQKGVDIIENDII